MYTYTYILEVNYSTPTFPKVRQTTFGKTRRDNVLSVAGFTKPGKWVLCRGGVQSEGGAVEGGSIM